MELRLPRTKIEPRGYWADTLALCHPKMLFVIACLLTIGHALSPYPINIPRYVLAVGGVVLVTLAAYRVNELEDGTTSISIPRSHHKALAAVFMASALICAAVMSLLYAWWIFMLALIGVGLIVLYNLDVHPYIHNRVVYALTWGFLPLLFSEFTQSLSLVPTAPVLLLSTWAGVVSVYTLWLWGPTTCGRMPVDRKCHSPVLRCRDRVAMPREVHEHQRVLINLNILSVLMVTAFIISTRW
jgi:heme O synthase-like polyprenyltransferase